MFTIFYNQTDHDINLSGTVIYPGTGLPLFMQRYASKKSHQIGLGDAIQINLKPDETIVISGKLVHNTAPNLSADRRDLLFGTVVCCPPMDAFEEENALERFGCTSMDDYMDTYRQYMDEENELDLDKSGINCMRQIDRSAEYANQIGYLVNTPDRFRTWLSDIGQYSVKNMIAKLDHEFFFSFKAAM